MVPELRLLRYFVAVADEGTVTRAAERLHLSQPALSAAVKQLEGQLGVELLDRVGRGVALTPAGELLARRGRALIETAEAMVAEVQSRGSAPAARLRLGLSPTARYGIGPELLAAAASAAPAVMLYTSEDTTGALLRDVAHGRLDLAVVFCAPAAPEGVELLALREEAAVVHVRADHPLAGARPWPWPTWPPRPSSSPRAPSRAASPTASSAPSPRRASSRRPAATRTRTSACRRSARAWASSSTRAARSRPSSRTRRSCRSSRRWPCRSTSRSEPARAAPRRRGRRRRARPGRCDAPGLGAAPGEHLGGGRGAADPEPLREVDAELGQQAQGPLVLDALGDRADAEGAGEAHDRLDEVTAGLVARQLADELDVDLQEVDRQALEVGEPAVAGPEVVERDPAAEVAHRVQEALGDRLVAQERGLGDLEDDERRVGPRLGELALDERAELRVADRLRRQVELDGAPPAAIPRARRTTQRSISPISPCCSATGRKARGRSRPRARRSSG
jgi:DNA-binding transcriptional LysR family regulator